MTPDETRVVLLLAWGGGTVSVYGFVLTDRVAAWHRHRDRRSLRELLTAFGLFLTALSAGLSVALVLYSPLGSDVHGFFTAVSLGAFFAVGMLMAGDAIADRRDDP